MRPAEGAPTRERRETAPAQRRRALRRQMVKTIATYGLIHAGDHVMVAISGGKDSYTLLDLLREAQGRAPFRFEITAVHLDQAQPGYDGRPLAAWLAAFGAPYEILREDTYSAVIDRTPAGKTYCAVCSRLRRGVLYSAAARLGCTTIALGHHRDDALETLLMNLFYAGKLQAMPAGYTTDDGRFRVIRPLIECAEDEIAAHAAAAAYPILPCNLCGSQDGLRREAMAALLRDLERGNPNLRAVMLSALKNVSATHLLDPSLVRRAPPPPDPSVLSAKTWPEGHDASDSSMTPAASPRRLPVVG